MTLFKIGFLTVTLVDAVDLLLVSWIFYTVYQYFKGTRAGQMLVGLIILLIASFLFNAFGFRATSWLVNRFQTVWVVAFVILFQPEIRRLLIYIGQHRFFQRIFRVGTSQTIENLVQTINDLIENPKKLKSFQVLALPGGFSYGCLLYTSPSPRDRG